MFGVSRRSIFIAAMMLLSGCGIYTFTGQGIGGIKSIAVEPIDNQTPEFGLGDNLTDAIVSKLLSDRTLTVADRASAEALLSGRIVSFTEAPLSYTSSEVLTENQVRITAAFELRRPDSTTPLWEGQITGVGSYPYSESNLESRNEGLKKALDDITTNLINKLTSDW